MEENVQVLTETRYDSIDFEYVRAFYRNSGYEEEARIRDFYTDGFDKIVFRKLLANVAAQ